MYLSKLEVHGFKSFADRTALAFDPGVTAVVGPNGCGKSNIVDAVRWVIGEQRARILRSDKMESVIFNGTAKKRPLGMAEVMLTIENNRGVLPIEYDEITIGRRLFRSGESEYLMNGVQCRLKDITDLFMDTGMGAGAYSVIELKMIEEILSDNAADRRRLFEEAAGITRYKLRRAQTLKKLQNTQVDLNRLRDLLDEIEKRVKSLQRQAAKASQFKEIEGRLRIVELSLARVEYDRLAELRRGLESELKGLQDQLEGRSAEHGQSEAQLEALRAELMERDETYAAAQRNLNDHLRRVSEIEADIRLYSERIGSGERDIARAKSEQEEADQQMEGLIESIQTGDVDLARARPVLEKANTDLEAATVERDKAQERADAAHKRLLDAREKEQTLADSAAEQHRQLDRLHSRVELLQQDAASATSHDVDLAEEADRMKAALAEADEQFSRARQVTGAKRTLLTQTIAEYEARQLALSSAEEDLRAKERKLEAATAEVQLLESVVSSYEDFSDAIQFLAEHDSLDGDELLTVADVIGCDDEYRGAIEAALEAFSDCVVVENEASARAALATLREAGKGRATFVVLNRLPSDIQRAEAIAGTTPLVDLVRPVSDRYAPLAELLLHNCFLADSLADVDIRDFGGARFFDRSGEWQDDRGLLHGGSQATESDGTRRIGRREQLRVTRERVDELTLELAQLRISVDTAAAALKEIDVEKSRSTVAEFERAEIEAEKRHAQIRFESENLGRRHAELKNRISSIQGSITDAQQEIESLVASSAEALSAVKLARSERTEAEEYFQQAEAENRAAFSHFSDVNVAAVEARNLVDNLERDLDRSRTAVDDLKRKAVERAAYVANVTETIQNDQLSLEGAQARLGEEKERREELEAKVTEAKDSLSDSRVRISELESQLRELRRVREEQLRAENQRAVRLAEVQTKTEELIRHIEEDYQVALADIVVDHEAISDEKAARQEVLEMRRQIRNMGPINELALSEFEEEKERMDFMSKQFNDLLDAEKTLLATIDEINTTASNRFNETFAAIQKNFTKLFTDLFGNETTAEISLEDPNDPLESAIEVTAKPRGKRPSVLAQLSGGEKTLTAIALLFAIYLVKPSPFCILDEVDAPLDDANVLRFMRIIREFSKTTQFILVTHNKRTMEAADRMYGVTMQEQGVSHLVGVKFEEAVELAQS